MACNATSLTFRATEAGCVEENGVIVCGASNAQAEDDYHYITLQQWAPGAENADYAEHDVHFEIDDPINSGYRLVDACTLTPTAWRLSLTAGVEAYPHLREVVVDLTDITAEDRAALRAGLERTFRDDPARLCME